MNTPRATLLSTLLAALACIVPATARSAGATDAANYLMWQMPPSGISFPVYVYSNGKQTGYLYGTTQQAFVGAYGSTTAGTYTLYYQNAGNWFSCTLVLANGAIASTTTCPGAVINAPVATSNVYTVAFGATAWQPAKAPQPAPVNTDYGKRRITFINNTGYPMIQIGEICTVSANPNNPRCVNKANLFQIARGSSQVFYVDDKKQEGSAYPAGLVSYGFSVTAYQLPAKNGKPGSIVTTGGYGGGNPYATKIEFTSLPVATASNGAQLPRGATNFDISAVDGYNIGARGYPEGPTYCTYTVPPENSNVLGAGLYSANRPLASISASPQVCATSSQLPTPGGTGAWPLAVKDANGNFQGCMSPCTYATANGNPQAPMFCCTGNYGTASSCDQPAGQPGANNSTYVTHLATATTNVYRFAYDDAIGDFACPAETNFVIEFTSN